MNKYNIGLDFGTYQTKACIYDLDHDVHEFFRFSSNNSFFLPSIVTLKKDRTFAYGHSLATNCLKEYHYFKIASAEDEEFRFETFDNGTQSEFYSTDLFDPFTPEFLSTIYLTFALFSIKEHYSNRSKQKGARSGVLGRLLSSKLTEEEIRFTIQLGIPTEWSQEKNLRRKRKFENILLIAEELQQHYTFEAFQKETAEILVSRINAIHKQHNFGSLEKYNEALNNLGISVFPETAAGLTFIVKTRQLEPGFYAIMDIGGGSTDISFFCVEIDRTIKYLASESYMLAANNVYSQFTKYERTVKELHEAEEEIKKLIRSKRWEKSEPLTKALLDVRKDLNKLVYKLFNKRVYFFKRGMIKQYSDQPILLYGGGARLPALDKGQVLIHDNGNPVSITIPCTYLEKKPIDRFTSIINILPNDNSWKSDFSILVVALGLSYPKPNSFADWFGDKEYRKRDGDPNDLSGDFVSSYKGPKRLDGSTSHQIPHPFNEDCYLFDVLESKWSKA